jgi:hypothetical protein
VCSGIVGERPTRRGPPSSRSYGRRLAAPPRLAPSVCSCTTESPDPPGAIFLDIQRFDQLARALATGRTRRRLLGIVITVGATLPVAATEAADNRNNKKKRVCHCADAAVASCTTRKLAKRKVKKYVKKNPCGYMGTCRNFNPCSVPSPAGCTSRTQCAGGQACIGGACQRCALNSQCEGRLCTGGSCVGGNACAISAECPPPLECRNSTCNLGTNCDGNDDCQGTRNTTCLVGSCVEACEDPGHDCFGFGTCNNGYCTGF